MYASQYFKSRRLVHSDSGITKSGLSRCEIQRLDPIDERCSSAHLHSRSSICEKRYRFRVDSINVSINANCPSEDESPRLSPWILGRPLAGAIVTVARGTGRDPRAKVTKRSSRIYEIIMHSALLGSLRLMITADMRRA